MVEQSGYRRISLGIVVEDKPPGTDYILVSPVEELNVQESGLIKEKTRTLKGNTKPVAGAHFDTQHQSKNYVRAKWVGTESGNRATAPDVTAGETVILSKFGNVDEYFWEDMGREPLLRKHEDVVYAYSNEPSSDKAYNEDSSYWMRVSTRDKLVHLHTSSNDGEVTSYDVLIDTKKGMLIVTDDLGNNLTFSSKQGVISITAKEELKLQAPKISLVSEQQTVQTKTLVHKASTITNDAKQVKNTGNVRTLGTDLARNQVEG